MTKPPSRDGSAHHRLRRFSNQLRGSAFMLWTMAYNSRCHCLPLHRPCIDGGRGRVRLDPPADEDGSMRDQPRMSLCRRGTLPWDSGRCPFPDVWLEEALSDVRVLRILWVRRVASVIDAVPTTRGLRRRLATGTSDWCGRCGSSSHDKPDAGDTIVLLLVRVRASVDWQRRRGLANRSLAS